MVLHELLKAGFVSSDFYKDNAAELLRVALGITKRPDSSALYFLPCIQNQKVDNSL
jgi:hypothetical protein